MNSDTKTDDYHPLLVGLRAARANLVPAFIVQAAMITLVLGYYYHKPTQDWLAHLAEAKRHSGFLFSFAAGALAGGVLPEILLIGVFQRGRVRLDNFKNLAFGIVFWGFQAMVVDAFYRGQARAFGSHASFCVVSIKVFVDQFVYNPIYAGPFGNACYEWKNQGYRLAGMSRVLTKRFYKTKTLPTLVATWGVWIPLVSMVYALPSLLQIPLFSLALTFWVMVFTWINHANRGK